MVNVAVSMTGFASRRGEGAGCAWSWDIRSVNGKGFDLRLRLPEGIEGLEPAVRAAVSGRVQRGNVTVGLRLVRDAAAEGLRINAAGLGAALSALKQVEEAAFGHDLSLTPASMAEVLSVRGVVEQGADPVSDPSLLPLLMADFEALLADFAASRTGEGAALVAVMAAQVDRIASFVDDAAGAAEARRPAAERTLRENLDRVLAGAAEADPQRVAQELALMAVKSDVTEEIDRLRAHVEQARGLIRQGGPIGRKLDFLMQEFMREANTLCSKAGDTALTRIGLDLKVVIDQLREQVQNVE